MQEAADEVEGGEESRVVGHVKWQVYTAYMKAVGTGLVLFVLLSLALMQASVSVTTKFSHVFVPPLPLAPPPAPSRSAILPQVKGKLDAHYELVLHHA